VVEGPLRRLKDRSGRCVHTVLRANDVPGVFNVQRVPIVVLWARRHGSKICPESFREKALRRRVLPRGRQLLAHVAGRVILPSHAFILPRLARKGRPKRNWCKPKPASCKLWVSAESTKAERGRIPFAEKQLWQLCAVMDCESEVRLCQTSRKPRSC
jgi:hypothetical protein